MDKIKLRILWFLARLLGKKITGVDLSADDSDHSAICYGHIFAGKYYIDRIVVLTGKLPVKKESRNGRRTVRKAKTKTQQ
jgi:hypothetical protein